MKKENTKDLVLVQKITLKDFFEYLENNALLVIITAIILLLTHGYLLFNNNVGVDTDNFIINPEGNHNWLQIGRYGLIVEKYILNLDSFNIFYAEVLFMFFLIAFCLVMYYTIYAISGKDFKYLNLCIPLVGITNPIFVEQFIFLLQSAEIAFTLLLTALAVLFIFKWIIDKKIIYAIFNVILLTIIFGTYQSFFVIYIAFCLFGFILLCENEEFNFKNNKDYWIQILKLLITFVIAFSCYQLILRYTNVDLGYLNQGNQWKWQPKRECLKRIYYNGIELVRGIGNYYNTGITIGAIFVLIIGIYNSIKTKKNLNVFNRLVYYGVYGLFAISPLFMTILLGAPPAMRSQFYIPLIESLSILLMTYYLLKLDKIKILKYSGIIVIAVITFEQSFVTSKLYYGDYLVRQQDIHYAYRLIFDMQKAGIKEGDLVYFFGHFEDRMNKSATSGEVIGYSSFENGYIMEPLYWYSSDSILKLFKSLGYTYNVIPMEKVFDARIIGEHMENTWPEENCMKKTEDGYWIIRMNGI